MGEHSFVDPISNQSVVLVVDPDSKPYDGTSGVRHAGCDVLADVFPELDAFACTKCRWSGRISGAWFMDLWGQAK